MGPIRALDAIIQKVPVRTKANSPSEKIVIIDCKTKKAIERRPWFGDVKEYLVVNTSEIQNPAEYQVSGIHINDVENDRSIGLEVKCWITCTPGNENKAAEALFSAEHPPAVVFEKLINRWVDEFVRSAPGDFITTYFDQKDALQASIKSRALADAGLTLQVKISLVGERISFLPVKIDTGSFLLRVSDYHEQQDVQITCRLEVDEKNRIRANIYRLRADRLKDVVIRQAQQYFEHNVSLEQFYDDLNQNSIIAPLKEALDKRLVLEGRRVEFIHLESTVSDSAPQQFENEVSVDVKVQEYPETVKVNNIVRMIRTDVARYKTKDSPALQPWLKVQLERIIPDLFFYKKYIDLLLEFKDPVEDGKDKPGLRKDIKDRLAVEAKKIGYDIKYLATSPNLQPLTWLDPFPIDVEDTFETRESKFYVKLNMHLSTRLTTLEREKVKSHLNKLEHIPTLMEKKVRDVTRDYIHTVDPERFYTTFTLPDKKNYPDNESIETELTGKVTEALQAADFFADVISFVPKMMDTDVVIRWRELQEKVCDFSFQVTPLRGGEPVMFTGKFQVESIAKNSWFKFQSRKFTIEDIRSHLEDVVRAKLKAVSKDELLFKGLGHLAEIQKAITLMAKQGIEELYGLDISVSMIDRAFTEVEEKINHEIIERDLASIEIARQKRLSGMGATLYIAGKKEEEIRMLVDERLRLGADAPDDQIADFEKRIKSEQEKLTPDLISPLADVERVLRPELAGEVRLIEHTRFKSLKAAASPNQGENHNHQEEQE
jgi:hypothetical protein